MCLLDLGWPCSTQKPLATPLLITHTAPPPFDGLGATKAARAKIIPWAFICLFIAQLCTSVASYSKRCTWWRFVLDTGREDVANKLFVILCMCLFPMSKQSRSPEPNISTARIEGDDFCGARSCNCKVCSAAMFLQDILLGTPYYKAEGWWLSCMQCKFCW